MSAKDPEQEYRCDKKGTMGLWTLGSSESLILLRFDSRAQSAFSVYDPLGHHSQHLLLSVVIQDHADVRIVVITI
jgi:hypothetical protein